MDVSSYYNNDNNYNWKRNQHYSHQVPAFGSWDCNGDQPLPFTQCFESARKPGLLLPYTHSDDHRDLYVAGDLYENQVVTPAMIVVPRPTSNAKKMEVSTVKKKKAPPTPPLSISPPNHHHHHHRSWRPPKAVDEDLYKISPHLLHHHVKPLKKKLRGFFSSCLLPTCG